MKQKIITLIDQTQEKVLRLFMDSKSYSSPVYSPYLNAHCGTFDRMHA